MRASPFVLCCWPGLSRLWLRGDWSAVAVAVVFGGVLNLLLVSTVLRAEVLLAPVRTLAWMAIAGIWLFSAIRSYQGLHRLVTPVIADDRGLFIQAQGEYLKGHWFEAESLLQQMLRNSRRDIEAHLMLATLCRRTRRLDEAHSRLDLIDQFDGAEKWRWEIDAERRLLQQQADETRNKVNSISTAKGQS